MDKPAEEITDIWLDKYEAHPSAERFSLAKDVVELAICCKDTYPFSMFENQLFRKLSDHQQRAIISELSADESETAKYIKAILESGPD